MDEKPKRKTHTSSEVKMRYMKKTYAQYAVKLRRDSDQDVIDAIEKLKAEGINTSAAVIQLIRRGLEK